MRPRKNEYFNQEKMLMYSIDQLEQFVYDYKSKHLVDTAIVIDNNRLYIVTTANSIKYQQRKRSVLVSTIKDDLNVNYYLNGKVEYNNSVAVSNLIQVQEKIFLSTK